MSIVKYEREVKEGREDGRRVRGSEDEGGLRDATKRSERGRNETKSILPKKQERAKSKNTEQRERVSSFDRVFVRRVWNEREMRKTHASTRPSLLDRRLKTSPSSTRTPCQSRAI